MTNLTPIIEESFTQYSGAVLQSRALADMRDCLKPSARQIFYCLYTDKFIHSKPFKKTLKAIGSAMRVYIHGDSSCEGVIMRAGQPFAMRYPLIEVEGSYGNLMESANWSAPRYTSARLSPLANYLFKDIEKDTIEEWRDNYDDTEQYPAVLPSKGFFNIVNGSFGIGIGAASSIPQFNLKEVNEALITLLLNPNATFEEVYCPPDFATGAILLNENEVKESLKNGYGFSCKLRSIVEFDKDNKIFTVKEIPFGVYTNTICKELEEILNGDDNPGIERFNDLTGAQPNIKIYLKKRANPNKVLRFLFKNTSLQAHYGINMTMLKNGRFPKTFGWREILLSHIEHEKTIYRKGFLYELAKKEARVHILNGLLICMARIEEVIEEIKGAATTKQAQKNLMEKFLLDEKQSQAVLNLKLSRLAHLEVEKLTKEKTNLEKEIAEINDILNNEEKFNQQLINGWNEVSNKFSDPRRTQILNVETEEDEPKEVQELLINLSNQNNIYVTTVSSLYTQRRGGVGNKFKMSKGEYVIATTSGSSDKVGLFFSNFGNYFQTTLSELPFEEVVPVESLFELAPDEKIEELTVLDKKNKKEFILFFTKNGIVKKSRLSEYNTTRKGGVKAIKLDNNDEIRSILFVDTEQIGMMTASGQLVICESKTINPIGRNARGVKGIKLKPNDELVSAKIVTNATKEFVSVSEQGYIKRTSKSECSITNRGTVGTKIHKLNDTTDRLIDFAPISTETGVIVVASRSQIKIGLNQINLLSKGAQGTKALKTNNSKVIGLSVL